MVVCNDPTVKGGTYYPVTVKKHLRAQRVAEENRLPCVYLVDSGGAHLPSQDEVFPDQEHFGRIFFNQANLSAAGIPQIAVVMGSCTAGGAYVPAMSDESIIVRNQGTIFLGGPPLVKAATGEVVSAEELGGGEVHARISGVVDHLAENDAHALGIARRIVGGLPADALDSPARQPVEFEEPQISGRRALRRHSDRHAQALRRARNHRAPGRWQRLRRMEGALRQPRWSPASRASTACRWRSSPTTASCSPSPRRRARTSSQLACQRRVPLVFLQNITGFMVGKKYENEGIARHGAKMVTAVACARVPKFTVIVGGSFGAGNYGMCGRAYAPRFLWTWPNSRISVMGGEQAANVLATVRRDAIEAKGGSWSAEEEAAFKAPIREQYEDTGQSVLRHGAALGRWCHRSGRHASLPGAGAGAQPAAAGARDALRRLPDVRPHD